MNDVLIVQLSLEECCQATHLSVETLIELVEHGIVEPQGPEPRHWRFDSEALSVLRHAARLRRELELDWAAIALALDLLAEVKTLRAENQRLRRRLERFTD
ncbi:chaperone modulatory protein CbpM [Pseudomonas daroniae]|uniref:Chaperone modulatory protein CbpM n=1 Tax=Phytopseudomonas daroniae TaxID=2487519 RepID=A0A4Q9QIT9_9GAMM|nr:MULTISPECIES: chaperone modulator CbpM [Pseudomonas]TBU71750.1 chaperone modulatory protein CbpM [Pseudomonas daroniae]TBU76564.1 chaperone modulatory protein CbpM [Pseudomonas daroniae]TBU80891.1 chaperone modulatory protein CbpM [Pseudomonas sp. FRB 228]TBU90129.1 chaperone modulatory protein CbpM [Pseudomonas daroniae]